MLKDVQSIMILFDKRFFFFFVVQTVPTQASKTARASRFSLLSAREHGWVFLNLKILIIFFS